jgi:hypothetical protein
VPVVKFYGPMKGVSSDDSPLDFLTKRDAFKLVEAFDKITSQRVRNSVVALVQQLSEPH